MKGHVPEHFECFRSTLSQSHEYIIQEMVICLDFKRHVANGKERQLFIEQEMIGHRFLVP